MEQTARRSSPMIWVGLGLTLALVLLALLMAALRLRSAAPQLPVLGTVSDFSLTNQTGMRVTAADLKGKVWIADIIFTRCAGPCLRMSQQMSRLQESLKGVDVLLVSLTTDPEYDTPEVLEKYAARFNADGARWQFLTGTKEQIAEMATGSLKLTGIEKKPEEQQDPADLFIHSTIFVVVDRKMQLRGVFETEGPDINPDEAREKILSVAKKLASEKP